MFPLKGLFEVTLHVRCPPAGVTSSTLGSSTNLIFVMKIVRTPSHVCSILAMESLESSKVKLNFASPFAWYSIVPLIVHPATTNDTRANNNPIRRERLFTRTDISSLQTLRRQRPDTCINRTDPNVAPQPFQRTSRKENMRQAPSIRTPKPRNKQRTVCNRGWSTRPAPFT